MELGWADSAPRLRSRLPNLNLLPAELLPPGQGQFLAFVILELIQKVDAKQLLPNFGDTISVST